MSHAAFLSSTVFGCRAVACKKKEAPHHFLASWRVMLPFLKELWCWQTWQHSSYWLNIMHIHFVALWSIKAELRSLYFDVATLINTINAFIFFSSPHAHKQDRQIKPTEPGVSDSNGISACISPPAPEGYCPVVFLQERPCSSSTTSCYSQLKPLSAFTHIHRPASAKRRHWITPRPAQTGCKAALAVTEW